MTKTPSVLSPSLRSNLHDLCCRPAFWSLFRGSSCAGDDFETPIDEARAILSEIYNRLTEGFDTADLKDAKALLDELNN